jgi:hypothetical protein
VGTEVCGSGYFNGDGRDDIVAFNKTYGQVWVSPSTGGSFGDSAVWTPSDKVFCWGQETCGVGDFNHDNRDDVVTFLRSLYPARPEQGDVIVARSNGSSFPAANISRWASFFCIGNETCGSGNYIDGISQTTYSQVSRTGDFNGDLRDDVVTFLRNTTAGKLGYVYVKLAYGNSFVDALRPPYADASPYANGHQHADHYTDTDHCRRRQRHPAGPPVAWLPRCDPIAQVRARRFGSGHNCAPVVPDFLPPVTALL